MKNKWMVALGFAIIMLGYSGVFAQRGRNFERQRPEPRQAYMNISNLSAEQQAQIKELHNAQLEQRTKFRSQMDELRARKQTLMMEKNPDMKAVNTVIDQMASLRSQMEKQAVQHRQQVRNLLTDEQRIQFDARTHRGPRQGLGRTSPPGQRNSDRRPRGGRR